MRPGAPPARRRALSGPGAGVGGELADASGQFAGDDVLQGHGIEDGPLVGAQSVWIALRANERAILDAVTLEHIVTGELPDRVRELTTDPRAWA